MKNISVIFLIGVLSVLGAIWLEGHDEETAEMPDRETYRSEKLGFSFSVPDGYFVQERDESTGERLRYAVVLMEDTRENRDLVAGKLLPGREAPPTITIGIFQNNLDHYSAKQFVEGTSFSNFKLSDGSVTEITVGGEKALRYHATGLYENENVVVARPRFVYMITAFYHTPSDAILSDVEGVLGSMTFR